MPTLIEALVRAAAARAPYLVLHVDAEPMRASADVVLEHARRWARALVDAGVRRGDPVALLLPTSIDFVGAFFGSLWLGAVPMPLASPMTFGPLDRYLDHLGLAIRHAGATALVTSPRISKAVHMASLGETVRAVLTPEDARKTSTRHAIEAADVGSRGPALLQYTSGTTGRPRGVVLTHGAIVANTTAIGAALGIDEHDVGVSWLPLYHDMGLIGAVLSALVGGYPLHLFSPEGFVMRPRRWLELMAASCGTLSTAPNFAYDLVVRRAEPTGLDLSSWRAALDGAEPVHAVTLARFTEKLAACGLPRTAPTPVYGLAEATLAVSFHAPGTPIDVQEVDRHTSAIGSRVARAPEGRSVVAVGAPLPGVSVVIADAGGAPLAEDVLGEIRVRSPSLMLGYHRDEAASAAALDGEWLRTGDLGFVHEGRLYVSGRARDLIIQGGRNVYPEDVERIAVEAHPSVLAAAAFARTDEESGTEDLVVVVEARGLDPQGKRGVESTIRGELLAAMGVRAGTVEVWPIGSIPRTSSGKVRRSACATHWASGGGPS